MPESIFFWGVMGTIVCFIVYSLLCTLEEPKAPEVRQSRKMFCPSPILIQRKANGLPWVNCIGPTGRDFCGASNSADFPVGVNVSPYGRFYLISFLRALSKVIFGNCLN